MTDRIEICPMFEFQNQTVESYEKISCTWKIENFDLLFQKEIGYKLKSPDFSSSDNGIYKWYVSIFPNGMTEEYKDYVSLFLRLISSPLELSSTFKLRILSLGGETILDRMYDTLFGPRDLAYGWYNFIKRKDLMTIIQDDGGIQIKAIIKTKTETLNRNIVLENFASMFEDSTFCDATLVVNCKKIHVHRNILALRSRKFADIFKNSMNKKNSKIQISDLSYDVLNSMIRFIYTNITVISNITMAENLLEAAKNYDLENLASFCIDYLTSILDESNVVHIYALTVIYGALGLQNYSFQYILDHFDKAYDSKTIQQAIKKNSNLKDGFTYLEKKLKEMGKL